MTFAVAKLTPLRLASTGTPGMGRGKPRRDKDALTGRRGRYSDLVPRACPIEGHSGDSRQAPRQPHPPLMLHGRYDESPLLHGTADRRPQDQVPSGSHGSETQVDEAHPLLNGPVDRLHQSAARRSQRSPEHLDRLDVDVRGLIENSRGYGRPMAETVEVVGMGFHRPGSIATPPATEPTWGCSACTPLSITATVTPHPERPRIDGWSRPTRCPAGARADTPVKLLPRPVWRTIPPVLAERADRTVPERESTRPATRLRRCGRRRSPIFDPRAGPTPGGA